MSSGFFLSSSSAYDAADSVYRAGYDYQYSQYGLGTWCTGLNDENQWIMITSVRPVKWVKVGTIGNLKDDYWISSYYLMYSVDGSVWINYNNKQVFNGNSDRNTIVEHDLNPFIATSIRIHPIQYSTLMCARVEAYCYEV